MLNMNRCALGIKIVTLTIILENFEGYSDQVNLCTLLSVSLINIFFLIDDVLTVLRLS